MSVHLNRPAPQNFSAFCRFTVRTLFRRFTVRLISFLSVHRKIPFLSVYRKSFVGSPLVLPENFEQPSAALTLPVLVRAYHDAEALTRYPSAYRRSTWPQVPYFRRFTVGYLCRCAGIPSSVGLPHEILLHRVPAGPLRRLFTWLFARSGTSRLTHRPMSASSPAFSRHVV